jgi:hypothetical protein
MNEKQFEKKLNQSPFKKPFYSFEKVSREDIKGLEGLPDIVVRKYDFTTFEHILRRQQIIKEPKESSTESFIEIFNLIKKTFSELKEKYNINVPEIKHMVISEDKNEEKIAYIIVDKIEGINIEKAKTIPFEAAEKLDSHYEKILEYIFDTYQNEKLFFNDIIYYDQLMYGKKKDDKEDKIYFVDTDPYFLNWEKVKPEEEANKDKKDFVPLAPSYIMEVLNAVHLIEKKIKEAEGKAIFQKTKQKAKEIFEIFAKSGFNLSGFKKFKKNIPWLADLLPK